jgi:hypothetical protein
MKRYAKNPFIENLTIETNKKQVRVSELGSDDNILINQTTGEVSGTHVVTYKKVDSEEFVKLFTKNIALTFGLTSAGLKALNVLMWALQNKAINKDLVQLESTCLSAFLEANHKFELKLSLATFNRGLAELVRNKIIAAQNVRGLYFINPSFAFNGNRVAFTRMLEIDKDEFESKAEIEYQSNFDSD